MCACVLPYLHILHKASHARPHASGNANPAGETPTSEDDGEGDEADLAQAGRVVDDEGVVVEQDVAPGGGGESVWGCLEGGKEGGGRRERDRN